MIHQWHIPVILPDVSVCAPYVRPFLRVLQPPPWRKQLKQQTEFLEGQDVPEGFTVMRTSPCSLMRTSPCLSQGFAVQSTSAPWLRGSPDRQEQETSDNEETITPCHCPELKRQPGSQEDKLLWGHSGNMMWPWEGEMSNWTNLSMHLPAEQAFLWF